MLNFIRRLFTLWGGGSENKRPAITFDGESCREWAREHRSDPPVHPSSTNHALIKAGVSRCKQEFEISRDDASRDAIQQEYSRLLSQIAPIRRLPEEILSMIFLDPDLVGSFADPFPLQEILLTCTRWRDIALSTPRLWDNMYLHFRDSLWPRDALERWIRRSKSTPLRVSLLLTPRNGEEMEYTCLEPILYETRRFTFLMLCEGETMDNFVDALTQRDAKTNPNPFHDPTQDPNLPPVNARFENLESLAFENMPPIDMDSFRRFVGGLHAPKLKELFLENVTINMAHYAVLVAATPNVTTVLLEPITWGYIDDDLTIGHPNVKALGVNSAADPSISNTINTSILARLLRESKRIEKFAMVSEMHPHSIFRCDPSIMKDIMDGPKPSVKELNISLHVYPDYNFRKEMANLLGYLALFPSVKDLTIRFYWVHENRNIEDINIDYPVAQLMNEKLLEIVRQMKALRELKIHGMAFNGSFALDHLFPYLAQKSRRGEEHKIKFYLQPVALLGYTYPEFGEPSWVAIGGDEYRELVRKEVPDYHGFHLGDIGPEDREDGVVNLASEHGIWHFGEDDDNVWDDEDEEDPEDDP